MSRRRRRALDFTDSLECFREMGESRTDPSCGTSRLFSEDSLNQLLVVHRIDETARFKKHNPVSSNKNRGVKHSEILAGSSTKISRVENGSPFCITECLPGRDTPDLNKRINLFQDENSSERVKDNVIATRENKENTDPLRPNRNASYDSLFVNAAENAIARRTSSESGVRQERVELTKKRANTEERPAWTISMQENDDAKTFESVLCALDNKLNQFKESTQTQHVLKRLSTIYNHSPEKFTEKLLTVIEGSIVSGYDDSCCTSGINLSRLTPEFKRMCKYIEDESMPDWPSSLIATPPHVEQKTTPLSPAHRNDRSDAHGKLAKSIIATPIHSIEKAKGPVSLLRRMARNVFNGNSNSMTNSPIIEHSNVSFERLEAQCNKLYNNGEEIGQPVRKSLSLPSLISMSDIQIICEKQMAALNISETGISKPLEGSPFSVKVEKQEYPSMEQLSPAESLYDHKKLTGSQHESISYLKRKIQKVHAKASPVQVSNPSAVYMTINPDELEKTLLQDIAEQRKRCLDTAKLLMEINTDSETAEMQKPPSPMAFTSGEHNFVIDEAKFLNTLMSCKKYHTYLTRQKPLLNFLQSTDSTTDNTIYGKCDSKEAGTRKLNQPLLTVQEPRCTQSNKGCSLSPNISIPCRRLFPVSCKLSTSKARKNRTNNNGRTTKPKLFLTPGKSPVDESCKKKRIYFPDMEAVLKSTPTKNLTKGSHAKEPYRVNYNTIVSPVGMYIRGTDAQLIKNVHGKTDELLLTPTAEKARASPTESATSRKFSKIQKKCPQKTTPSSLYCSTPKLKTDSRSRGKVASIPTTEENAPNRDVALPKVSYKLPLQVRTIKENERKKVGNRVKGLLESAQTKVVIRHGERENSAGKKRNGVSNDDETFEINYNPEDESVHVEQAASKTNFIYRQRNM